MLCAGGGGGKINGILLTKYNGFVKCELNRLAVCEDKVFDVELPDDCDKLLLLLSLLLL